MARKSPNPESKMLAKAVVAGAGMGMPGVELPEGMGAVLLYVPLSEFAGKSIHDIQADLGIRWHMEGGPGVWLDEL